MEWIPIKQAAGRQRHKMGEMEVDMSRYLILIVLILALPGFALAGGTIDLSGDWDLVLSSGIAGDVGYGGTENYEAKITQEGSEFVCTCVTSGKRFGAGEKILKGQVAGRVFSEVYVHVIKDPVSFTHDWVRGNGVVLEDGKTLIVQVFNEMHASNVTVTLKKKSGTGGGKQ